MFHPVKRAHPVYLIKQNENENENKTERPWIISFPAMYNLWVIDYKI